MNSSIWDSMTYNYINTSDDLNNFLESILNNVINNVADYLLKDFQEHLDKTIYSAPPGEYKRNYNHGGFYDGWILDNKSDMGSITKLLRFDGSRLVAPTEENLFAHGGRGTPGEDIRDIMDEVLNSPNYNDYFSYNGGAHYLTTGESVGYWNSYIIDLDNKIEKKLNEEFKKYGISGR